MSKRVYKFITVIIILIVISNAFSGYINIFTEGIFRFYYYETENKEFEFIAIPSKGRDLNMMERQFSTFKKSNVKFSEIKIYRTFNRNPFKFWNWYSYLTDEKYKFPFKEKIK